MTDINSADAALSTDLLGIVAGIRRALRRRVGTVGGVNELTDAQRELVRFVRLNPNSRIGEAATALHLAPNTVSTLVGALAASDWIEREADPDDARSTRLRLSAKAEAGVAEWRDLRSSILSEHLNHLDPDQRRQIEAAVPALRQLVADLQECP